VLTGLRWGSSSWADAIEARRLRPGEDHAGATVAQVTDLLAGLAATGKWRPGDPPPLVMFDAGYPATGISWALDGKDVQVLVRLRSTRVFHADPAERAPGQRGAPRRHGQRFALDDTATHHAPGIELAGESARYGKVAVRAWKGLHQALGRPGRWQDYPEDEPLPVVTGTVIQVSVERLPDGRKPHDLRRPWHKKPEPGQILSPYRVRLGFRRLRAHLGTPARTAKSTRPGPGRPRGSKNRPKARQQIYRKSDNQRTADSSAAKQDP